MEVLLSPLCLSVIPPLSFILIHDSLSVLFFHSLSAPSLSLPLSLSPLSLSLSLSLTAH